MIKNVLLPTDFSENSKIAIRYAIDLYLHEDTNFYLLNAYDVPHAGASMLVSIEDILNAESEKGLHDLRMELSGSLAPGDQIQTVIEKGDLSDVVNRVTERLNIDAIAIGTKGASGLKEKLIGSNAFQVMQNSKVPVWVIPEHVKYRVPQHIGLASDFSGPDERVLAPLLDLQHRHNCDIRLVNVNTKPVMEEAGVRAPNAFVKSLVTGIDYLSGEDLVATLNDWATENDIDILAMIRHKKSFFDRILNKSNTKQMSMHSNLPLLVMRD